MVSTISIKGIGGLFFIVISILMSMIFVLVLHFSRTNTAIAIASNFGHIVATQTAIFAYQTDTPSGMIFYNSGPFDSMPTTTDSYYFPLSAFNSMFNQLGWVHTHSTYVSSLWDRENRVLLMEFGPFRTTWGSNIRISMQRIIIEDF